MKNSSALSRLLNGLRSEPHDFRGSLQVFPDLSSEKLVADLELEAKGREYGVNNEPAATSSTLDKNELAIIERIEAEQKSAHATFLEHLDAYSERIRALDFEGRFAEIQQAAPEAIASLRTEAANGRNELNLMRRHLKDLEVEKLSFQKAHNLKRTAKVYSRGTTAIKIGTVLVLLLIETLLNGAFLSKGNELGFLGGTLEAAAFAFLNVLAAFGLGRLGAPELVHRNPIRKILGGISVVIFFVFLIALNLGLAHYREVTAVTADAGQVVVLKLLKDPFNLVDFKSWLFFALGSIFGIIAFIDGIVFDDPYPGYGLLQRRLSKAHDEYTERVRVLVEELEEIRQATSEAVALAGRDLSKRRIEFDQLLMNRSRLANLFHQHQVHLERTCNYLLSVYRDANRRARSTPVPERFTSEYLLRRIDEPDDNYLKGYQEKLNSELALAQSDLLQHATSISEEFERAAKEYRLIDAIVDERERDGSAVQQAS